MKPATTKFILIMNMVIFIILTGLFQPVLAKDLGVFGQTYPIYEEDFLEFIQHRVMGMQQQGEWAKVEKAMQQHAASYRDRPEPVHGLSHTEKSRTFFVNPTITLDHDVISPDGKMIAKAGSSINPLIYVPLTKTLIFYDADDAAQVKWVQEQDKGLAGKDKLILVNGSILNEGKRFKKAIYFDQAGRLTTRFGIKHTPATVKQSGMLLSVSEIKL